MNNMQSAYATQCLPNVDFVLIASFDFDAQNQYRKIIGKICYDSGSAPQEQRRINISYGQSITQFKLLPCVEDRLSAVGLPADLQNLDVVVLESVTTGKADSFAVLPCSGVERFTRTDGI